MSRFVMGLMAGAVMALVLLIGGTAWLLPPAVAEATRGWHLTTIMVASRDVPVGRPLEWRDMGQRDIPEQFVSDAHMPAGNAALLIGRSVPRALKAGEPLVYSDFAPALGPEAVGCE